ncbi:MAG: amino acid kinase family protein [Candidatus Odinarchaeia archaeon]
MIDIVVKVGGSLFVDFNKTALIFNTLLELIHGGYRLVVVPGGGMFADSIRMLQKKYNITDDAAHWLAILSMVQTAYLIMDINKYAVIFSNIKELNALYDKNFLPIVNAHDFLKSDDRLPHSWDITSDSISVFIANKLNSKKLILLKDVDGIFTGDPQLNNNYRLKKRVTLKDFELFNYNVVDNYFPYILKDFLKHGSCWIINGNFPYRIKDLLEGKKIIATEIVL